MLNFLVMEIRSFYLWTAWDNDLVVKSSDEDVWKDTRTSEFLPLSMEVTSVI